VTPASQSISRRSAAGEEVLKYYTEGDFLMAKRRESK
jgi:hypothetical protein